MIFIVGVGRSGTSLVQSMLSMHSQIAFIPEINYLRRFLFASYLEKYNERHGWEKLLNYLSEDSLLKRARLNFREFLLEEDLLGSNLDLKIFNRIKVEFLRSEGKSIFGYKDPRCIEHLPRIRSIFPGAFVIHVIRDPRDILVSKRRAEWSKHKPYYFHILANQIQLQLGSCAPALFKDRFINIYYESLISDPVTVLKDVCARLGVPYEKQMLDFSISAGKLVSRDELQWKKETMGPLLTRNMKKWKGELSNWQITLLEETVNIAFKDYKYQKSFPRLGTGQMAMLPFCKPLIKAVVELYVLRKRLRS
jgi:hypothetical protein